MVEVRDEAGEQVGQFATEGAAHQWLLRLAEARGADALGGLVVFVGEARGIPAWPWLFARAIGGEVKG